MSGKVATRTLEAALLALAGSQHRVVGRVQLRELGLSDDQTDWRMERGWLRRLYRGVYQVGPGALTREGHWMAATLAVGHRGALSHRSAAELWGLIPGCSSPVHVTAPGTGGRSRRSGLIVHRFTAPTETIIKRRILVSTPSRTIIDLAEVVDRRTLERALDEAERLRVCTEAQLRRAIERHPGRSGAAKLRAVLEGHAVGNTATENDFEELMLALCDENAIPRPRCQLPLGDYHPDFAWPEHGVIVETDGRATHGTRKAFEADRARDAELTTAGWRVLRFTWRHLTERPEWVARKVKDALGVLPHGR